MKLKEIPQNTVVYTPTEEEAKELLAILHENGYRWNMGGSLISNSKWSGICYTSYHIYPDENVVTWNHFISAGAITLAEFKERHCEAEKPQPKFKVGDKVIAPFGTLKLNATIIGIDGCGDYAIEDSEGHKLFHYTDVDLEPYTEPETKEETMETKENHNLSQDIANCDKSEDKELNLTQLLIGHEGENFWSPVFGDIRLSRIDTDDNKPLLFEREEGNIYTYPDGKMYSGTLPIVFPSRALYEQYPLDAAKAWSVWQEQQKKFDMHIQINTTESDCFGESELCDTLHFRNSSDRDKCLSEIKAIIEKYSK